MIRYAILAKEHWQKYLPKAYATIQDPETETFMEKVSRYRWARFNAESTVMREFLLPPGEETPTSAEPCPEDAELEEAVAEFWTLRESLYEILDKEKATAE